MQRIVISWLYSHMICHYHAVMRQGWLVISDIRFQLIIYRPISNVGTQNMATSNQNPLSDFTSLGPSILFYLPPSTTSHDPNITTPPPSLIILATWNSALPKHIAKYTTNYRTIYPSSPILIIRNTIADLVIRSYSSQEQRLIAALPVLQEYGTGKILLHLFSNGGASMATQLARTYKIEMGRPLSVGALVLDSSPGEATFKRTANATIATLPKGILYVYCIFIAPVSSNAGLS